MRQDKTVARILFMFFIANIVLAAPVLVRQRRYVTDRTNDEPMGEPEQDPAGPVHPATPPPPAWPDTSSYKGKISEENFAPDSPSGLLQMSHLPPPQPSELKHSWLTDPSQDRWNQYWWLHSDWHPPAPPAALEAGDLSHKMLPPPQPSKLENSWSPNPSQDRPDQYEESLDSVWRPPAPPATLVAGDSSHKMLPQPQPLKLENSWSQDLSQDRPNQYDGSLDSVWRLPTPPATLEAEDLSHKMLPSPQPSKLENSWSQDPSQDRPNQYDGSLDSVWRPPAPLATLEAGDLSHKMLPPPQPSELKHTDPSQDRWNQYEWWLHSPPIKVTAWDSSHEMLPPALEDRPSQIDPPALEDSPSQIDPATLEDHLLQKYPETLEVHPFDDAWHQLIPVNVKDMDQASTPSWPSDHSGWEEDAAEVADETHLHP